MYTEYAFFASGIFLMLAISVQAQTELDIKATVVPAIVLNTADGPCVYCPDCNGPITQGPIPECTREQVEAYYYE